MSDEFKLDVDVSALRRAQRRLGAHSRELDTRERTVRRLPDQWASGWTGGPADLMAGQARSLAKDTRGFVSHFSDAADAVKAFADAVDDAESVTLPDLNRRWRAAQSACDAALASASGAREQALGDIPAEITGQQRKQWRRELDDSHSSATSAAYGTLNSAQQTLRDEYDALVTDLRSAARKLGGHLTSAVALPIKVSEAGHFTRRALDKHPMGTLPSDELLTQLQEQAEKKYGGPAHDLLLDLASPTNDLAEVTTMLEKARGLGLEPFLYAPTLEQYWFLEAAAKAGIDVTKWDPSKGAAHNKETIMAVYRYYGDLYLENSDLQWAGMANMIGPSFAGGFLDLSMIRDMAQYVEKFPVGAGPLDREMTRVLAGLTDDDLEFYETTLLGMQREIFFDQGTMHEAYRSGGMQAIRELHEAGILDRTTYESWQGIDSGDPDRVQASNEQFLLREQLEIIEDDYQAMYHHPVTGKVVTWGMTQIGAPSIPGAVPYAEIDPLRVAVPTPGPRDVGIPFTPFQTDNPLQGDVLVDTPFANGNVANFDDRWRLIEENTLPAYQKLLRDDPDRAEALIRADVSDRVDDYRLTSRFDDIALDFLTNWDVVGFEQ